MKKSTIFGTIGLMFGMMIGAILASIGYPPDGFNGVVLGMSTTGIGCICGSFLDTKNR